MILEEINESKVGGDRVEAELKEACEWEELQKDRAKDLQEQLDDVHAEVLAWGARRPGSGGPGGSPERPDVALGRAGCLGNPEPQE